MTPPIMTVDTRMICNSGIGTYISNLLPRIIQDSDWHFDLIGDPENLRRFDWTTHPRVTIHSVQSPIYSLRQQLELPRLVRRDCRLFWSPHYDIPLFLRAPLLITIHDMAHLALHDVFRGPLRQTYAKVMMAAVRYKAAHIMFDSRFTAAEFDRLVGSTRCQSDIVYLAVDEDWCDPRYQSMPCPRPRPYLIYVGNVKPHKNLAGLLKAFALLHQRISHDLVIVGRREGFVTSDPEFSKLIESDDRVVFTGPISDPALKRYVAQASLLVQPSFYEGFGLTPIEAMACGCPAAVSNLASLPEICGDGAAYFDPRSPAQMAQTIAEILSSPDRIASLKKHGLARAMQFDWDRSAGDVMTIMSRFMNR